MSLRITQAYIMIRSHSEQNNPPPAYNDNNENNQILSPNENVQEHKHVSNRRQLDSEDMNCFQNSVQCIKKYSLYIICCLLLIIIILLILVLSLPKGCSVCENLGNSQDPDKVHVVNNTIIFSNNTLNTSQLTNSVTGGNASFSLNKKCNASKILRKRIMSLPLQLMVSKSEAHDMMLNGDIMHNAYQDFVKSQFNADINYLVDKFMSVYGSTRELLFNMHYMNQRHCVKFNKLLHGYKRSDYNLTVEVEGTDIVYKYTSEPSITGYDFSRSNVVIVKNAPTYEYDDIFVISINSMSCLSLSKDDPKYNAFWNSDNDCEPNYRCMYLFQIKVIL